jgi:hypothetical protein
MTYRLIGVLTVDPSSSAEKEPKTDIIGSTSPTTPSNAQETAATGANAIVNKAGTSVPTSNAPGLEDGEVEIKSRRNKHFKKCLIL